MADATDMILPMLREMRAEMALRFDGLNDRFDRVDQRLAALEKTQDTFRHALSADSLLSKLVTGEFEGRIELLERNVAVLQTIMGAKR